MTYTAKWRHDLQISLLSMVEKLLLNSNLVKAIQRYPFFQERILWRITENSVLVVDKFTILRLQCMSTYQAVGWNEKGKLLG